MSEIAVATLALVLIASCWLGGRFVRKGEYEWAGLALAASILATLSLVRVLL